MSDTRVLIYRYGLLDPIDWDEDCREQLWKRNALRNRLVEIEHAHRERYFALLAARPEVAGLEAQMTELLAHQGRLRAERKARRKAERKKVATAQLDAELRDLARQMEPLRAQLKMTRACARDAVREELKALDQTRADAADAAAKSSGIYWCGYNAVLKHYDADRSKAMKNGAQLRFHRFEGEGSFDVQFIGGTHLDARGNLRYTPSQKMATLDLSPQAVPGKERVTCRDGRERGGRPQPRLTITAYMREQDGLRTHRKLTFPIILDRPLPAILSEGREEARIQEITVTRRRCGTRFAWHAVFKLRMPAQEMPQHLQAGRRVALNLGFRERPDGDLRVAMLWDGERHREISLPRAWRDRLRSVETVRAARDTHLDAITAHLRAQWKSENAPAELAERIGHLLRAPKFGAAKLAGCVLRWRNDPTWAPHQPELQAALEAWRRADKHYFEREAHGRGKALAHREDMYRQLARTLAAEYGEIRIGAIDLKEMARVESAAGVETELHARARANRHEASLYQLKKEIERQAAKTGTTVIMVAAPYTPICHTCGQSMPVDQDLMVTCPQGHVWDQDEVAARNIFAAPCERSDGETDTRERSQQAKQRLTRTERMRAARERKREAQRSRPRPQAPDTGGI